MSEWTAATRSPSTAAPARTLSRATEEPSTAVTSHPWRASQRLLRPSPAPRSTARPGWSGVASSTRAGSGSVVKSRSTAAYLSSQVS